MYSKSEKMHLLIVGITALVCSRSMFFFFDDPEGPNLLVVMVMAIAIYFLSLRIHSLFLSASPKRFFYLRVIFIQVVIAVGFFLCLR